MPEFGNDSDFLVVSHRFKDTSSPYYSHSGDNPSLLLVSILLFDISYHSWRRAILTALTAKHKRGLIDGSIPSVAPDDLLFDAWTRFNNMVIYWLLNSFTPKRYLSCC